MKTTIDKLQHLQDIIKNKKDDQSDYHEMIQALVNELVERSLAFQQAEKDKTVPMSFFKLEKEWKGFMTTFIQILENWQDLDFLSIKKMRLYEEMEDLMADLDDWLEAEMEEEENNRLHLNYIENWDIGVFFQ